MRLAPILLIVLVASGSLAAQEIASGNGDPAAAEREFARAKQLEKSGHTEEALAAVSQSLELSPGNAEYLTTREMLRQHLVKERLATGNRLANAGDTNGAAAQFRAGVALDPENTYLQQRLRDVSSDDPDRQRTLQILASIDQIELSPEPGKKSIHVRGDTRAVYTEIARAFGLLARFDDGLTPRSVRFDLDDVDFATAATWAAKLTHTFWGPITSKQLIVANDTAEMRKQYERQTVRTFYVGNAISQNDLMDVTNALRNIFQIQILNASAAHDAITVKAPKQTVDAAASFIENLMDARPELLIDVQEMEIDTDRASQYGLVLPTSFEAFNVFSEIYRVLGPNAQSVINQLKTTGTIDPSTIPAADLANLQGSPLLSPFIFFGKGYGLTGIVANPISGNLSRTSSVSTNLEHATLRAMDGESVKFRVGTRFPLLTGTFTNVAFSGQGAAVVGNTPQIQYTDLGVSLNIKPHYHIDDEVQIDFEFEIQGLGAASLNGIPELTTRSFKGNIIAKAGEPAVITGQINEQESFATTGYPGISQVPVAQAIMNNTSRDRTHNQIVIVMTPYVLRKPFHDNGSSVWWNAPSAP